MSLDMGEEECAKDRPQLVMVGLGLGHNQGFKGVTPFLEAESPNPSARGHRP